MFHIIVNSKGVEKIKGKASNRDELISLLNPDEIKFIFDNDAYNAIEDVFKEVKKKQCKDSYICNIKDIQINVVSDGYKITTLVFYL